VLGDYGIAPPREAFARTKAAAAKALELDETLAEAHASLALAYHLYGWDWSRAEQEFKRAIELNPNYATAHFWYAMFLSNMGRHTEALAAIKKAQELDPLSVTIQYVVGFVCYLARQYDQALEELRKAVELGPDFPVAHSYLGRVYIEKGMLQAALAEFEKAVALSGRDPYYVSFLGYGQARAGNRVEAEKLIAELKELSKRRFIPSSFVALVYVGLGDKDQAFAWLEKAYEEREMRMIVLKASPTYDSLRSEPRFQALLRRMNFPQ